jgi:cytidine deaminase
VPAVRTMQNLVEPCGPCRNVPCELRDENLQATFLAFHRVAKDSGVRRRLIIRAHDPRTHFARMVVCR